MEANPQPSQRISQVMQQPHGPTVHRITNADESRSSDMHSRMKKYTISMSVRMACFIAAFFFEGWLRWAFFAGAAVLPYIAVVLANGGANHSKRTEASLMDESAARNSLGATPTASPADAPDPAGTAPGATSGADEAAAQEYEEAAEHVVLEGLLLEDREEEPGKRHHQHGGGHRDGDA